MKVMKVKLSHDDDCYMCPGYNRRTSDGKLINHRQAGADCQKCNRHVHSRTGGTGPICIACGNS